MRRMLRKLKLLKRNNSETSEDVPVEIPFKQEEASTSEDASEEEENKK